MCELEKVLLLISFPVCAFFRPTNNQHFHGLYAKRELERKKLFDDNSIRNLVEKVELDTAKDKRKEGGRKCYQLVSLWLKFI